MKIFVVAFKHIHKTSNCFFYFFRIKLFVFVRIKIYLIEYIEYFLFYLFTFVLDILLFLKAYRKWLRFTLLTIFSLFFLLDLSFFYLTNIKYWALIDKANILNNNILIKLFPHNIQYLRLEFFELDQLIE